LSSELDLIFSREFYSFNSDSEFKAYLDSFNTDSGFQDHLKEALELKKAATQAMRLLDGSWTELAADAKTASKK
jgi:hypothetical protein